VIRIASFIDEVLDKLVPLVEDESWKDFTHAHALA
jgi:hypothetical protein